MPGRWRRPVTATLETTATMTLPGAEEDSSMKSCSKPPRIPDDVLESLGERKAENLDRGGR